MYQPRLWNEMMTTHGAVSEQDKAGVLDAHTLIDGNWLQGQTVDVPSPYDGKPVGAVHNSTVQQVGQAVESAARASAAWGEKPAYERSAILADIARLLHSKTDELARVMALDTVMKMVV